MTEDQLIEDHAVMVAADLKHLANALKEGMRVEAHRFVDAIIDNRQELEDLGVQVN